MATLSGFRCYGGHSTAASTSQASSVAVKEATVASASMAEVIKKNHNLLKILTEVVVG